MPGRPEEDDNPAPPFHGGHVPRGAGLPGPHDAGEIMGPPDLDAAAEPATGAASDVINYYFPVEIVIVGSLPEEERAALEARIWENLGDALDRMT